MYNTWIPVLVVHQKWYAALPLLLLICVSLLFLQSFSSLVVNPPPTASHGANEKEHSEKHSLLASDFGNRSREVRKLNTQEQIFYKVRTAICIGRYLQRYNSQILKR